MRSRTWDFHRYKVKVKVRYTSNADIAEMATDMDNITSAVNYCCTCTFD